MKLDFTKAVRRRMLANLVVVLAGISFYFALLHLTAIRGFCGTVLNILQPFVFAFLLNNPVIFFDRLLAKYMTNKKMRRGLAVFLVMVLVFVLLGLLAAVLIPQLMDSILMLIKNIQDFIYNMEYYVGEWASVLEEEYHIDTTLYENLTKTWENILGLGSSLLLSGFQRLLGLTGQVTSWVLNFFVALIISVYLLMSKERFFAQLRKTLYALFKRDTVKKMLYVARLTGSTFNGFINGKLIDSLIIGILAFVCLSIMKMPYALLISVIIGVTNIIPFFGPFIGAVPSTFIILIVDPLRALWFVIFILILQQIDGNIIGPKILGNTTGLPAIWVMFAILVGGGMAGFVGMIAGVPTVAVLYTLFKAYVRQKLEQKSLPGNTAEYLSAETDPYQIREEKQHATESVRTDS